MAPPYSPPRQRPWIKRRAKSRIAARIPILAYVGITPMSAVERPMPLSVTRNVYLRPTLSPTQPNTNAPSGRMRNPMEKSATVLRNAATGWLFSKNLTERIAARLPKM